MSIKLYHRFQQFEFKSWRETRPEDITLSFRSTLDAVSFLQGFIFDTIFMTQFRQLHNGGLEHSTFRFTDHQVIEHLATLLVAGKLRVIQPDRIPDEYQPGQLGSSETQNKTRETSTQTKTQRARSQAETRDAPNQNATPSTLKQQPKQVSNWIKFQIVDEETGKPISGVKLKLKLPNQNINDHTTGTDGMIHLTDLTPGTCDLEEMLDDQAFEVIQVE